MPDAEGFERVERVETLDIFLGILTESELDPLFEEQMDNIRCEVIPYR